MQTAAVITLFASQNVCLSTLTIHTCVSLSQQGPHTPHLRHMCKEPRVLQQQLRHDSDFKASRKRKEHNPRPQSLARGSKPGARNPSPTSFHRSAKYKAQA